jgi:hypothetical protein
MRELLRRESPAGRGAAPLTLPRAQAEALRLAHLLRLGFDDEALDGLEAFLEQIGGALGEAARHPAGGPVPQVSEVLKALQMAALCQGRGDLIGLADLLEHRVAVSLREAQAAVY